MWHDKPKAMKHYNNLKEYIHGLYPEGLSEHEADKATRNLLGFAELMLEISCDMERKKQSGKELA